MILFALHETPGVGWKTIRSLLERVAAIQEIVRCRADDFAAMGIRRETAIELEHRLAEERIRPRLAGYEREGVRVVTLLDSEYPDSLRRIAQPPWVLYAAGRLSLLSGYAIGIVGTRTPTVYGKKAAEEIAKGISQHGVRVVSGLARGIDTCAHLGALDGKGGTIAVLGAGVDTVYPPENAAVYRSIREKGLLLSEMPYGTLVSPGLFPLRNRIIAGMTLGTVVVEAAEGSGSLITAESAMSESRDVFAVPGPIGSPKSWGTNRLIKQGGTKLVTSAEDVLEEYNHLLPAQNRGKSAPRNSSAELTEEERRVLSLLSSAPATFDLLLAESGMDFGHLHSVLLSLIVKRLVIQLPGSAYVTL